MSVYKPSKPPQPASRSARREQVSLLLRIIHALAGVSFAFLITLTYVGAVAASIIRSFQDAQSGPLLSNALALVSTALSGVIGYFLGRNTASRK